jgi:hypothetical protein
LRTWTFAGWEKKQEKLKALLDLLYYITEEWNNSTSSNYFLSSFHIAYIQFDLLSSSSTWNSEELPQIFQPEPLFSRAATRSFHHYSTSSSSFHFLNS